MELEFKNVKGREVFNYSQCPILNISKITFHTAEKNWSHKLFSAYFTIKIICFDKDRREISSYSEPLEFAPYITPNHISPVLEMNRFYSLTTSLTGENLEAYPFWTIEISLNNLKLERDERIIVQFMDTDYVKKRVDDWSRRVNDVIESIENWLQDDKEYSIAFATKQKMHEGLMKSFKVQMTEINSANVTKDGELVLAIKPFGLWIIGANGRIDLLTRKQNFVMVDKAEALQVPNWKVYLTNDKTKGVDFSKDVLKEILLR